MKQILKLMACAALGAAGCAEQPAAPEAFGRALTPAEIEAGILTPEVMWKMTRAGSSSLSPDGSALLYAATNYDTEADRGITQLFVEELESRTVRTLTGTESNSSSPRWSADGATVYFLSDRSGSQQLWSMDTLGGNLRQLTRFDRDVEGFGISPRGDKMWYVQTVPVAARRSADIYPDMARSKARIYDDLMVRHWDYWDEGSYRHLFVTDFDGEEVQPGVDIVGAEAAYDVPMAPYFDMDEIAWNNAGTMIAYTCKPMTGTEYALSTDSDIFVYSLESGTTQNICKPRNFGLEGAPVIDSVAMPGYDKYPVWSPDDTKIAFRSMAKPMYEADRQRLFLYDCATGGLQELTSGFDHSAMNVRWNGSGWLWFIAPIEGTHQLCRVPAAGGSVDSRSVFELMVYSSLTNLPALLALSIFIAILMVMIRSWQDSEMVVWFSSGGLSLLRWISPVLRFSLPMIVLVALISLVVTPWAKAQIERTSQQFEQRDDVNRISPGRFIETEGGARVFFIEEVSEDGTRIKNVFMSQRSGRGETILKADSGEIRVNENGIRYVVLKNGRRYDTSEKADAAWRVVDFDNYELRLESKADQAYASRDVEELPLDRLLRLDTPVAKAELVWRLCWPRA